MKCDIIIQIWDITCEILCNCCRHTLEYSTVWNNRTQNIFVWYAKINSHYVLYSYRVNWDVLSIWKNCLTTVYVTTWQGMQMVECSFWKDVSWKASQHNLPAINCLLSHDLWKHTRGKLFNITSVCILLCRKFKQTGSRKRPSEISVQRHKIMSYNDFQHYQDQLCKYILFC